MEWTVFLVISTLVAFLIAIVGALNKYVSEPINELVVTLTKTNVRLGFLQESDREQNNRLNLHKERLHQHDRTLDDHESRIKNIEYIKERI